MSHRVGDFNLDSITAGLSLQRGISERLRAGDLVTEKRQELDHVLLIL
ncbi:Unknown protein sequence [Pseudomonas amygdali pv. morsprunorum]|nr:Unknown protein sequence [Pseudomonas amygdali pv. morsprunorum]